MSDIYSALENFQEFSINKRETDRMIYFLKKRPWFDLKSYKFPEILADVKTMDPDYIVRFKVSNNDMRMTKLKNSNNEVIDTVIIRGKNGWLPVVNDAIKMSVEGDVSKVATALNKKYKEMIVSTF